MSNITMKSLKADIFATLEATRAEVEHLKGELGRKEEELGKMRQRMLSAPPLPGGKPTATTKRLKMCAARRMTSR